jgi:hypothetical protein
MLGVYIYERGKRRFVLVYKGVKRDILETFIKPFLCVEMNKRVRFLFLTTVSVLHD